MANAHTFNFLAVSCCVCHLLSCLIGLFPLLSPPERTYHVKAPQDYLRCRVFSVNSGMYAGGMEGKYIMKRCVSHTLHLVWRRSVSMYIKVNSFQYHSWSITLRAVSIAAHFELRLPRREISHVVMKPRSNEKQFY